jgi:hypothetical protein
MHNKTYRALVVAGMMINAAFLALLLADYYKWDGANFVPLVLAWLFFVFLLLLLVFFGRPESVVRVARVEERTERVERAPRPLPEPAFQPVTPASVPHTAVVKSSGVPFVYNGYTLYGRDVELKNGGTRPIWFFSKHTPKSGKMVAKPANMHVGVNERTGLPFLKKGAGKDGEDLTPEIEEAYRPQCSAITEGDKQCRNSAREGSKYCSSHFGYQPPSIAKAEAKREDTLPRVKGAPDTLPSIRKKSTA